MKKLSLLLLTMFVVTLCAQATDYPGHPGFVGKVVWVDDEGFPCGEPEGDPNFQFAYCFEYGFVPGENMPVAIMLRTQYLADNGFFPMPSYYNIVDPDFGTLMCKVIGISAGELFWYEYISNAVTVVTLPSELEFIVGDGALSFPHVTSLTLPASLEYMDVKALNRCTMLTDLTVADSNKPLQILGTQSNSYGSLGAFGVPPLVNAYVGKNVIAEESPFKRTSSPTLKHVTLAGNGQLVYDKMFNQQNVLETATLKEGVGDIGEKAFYECRALTGISIPGTTTRIGKNAFAGDTTMTTVSLHEGLKYIDYRAFESCYKVGELYLPASLDSIHSEAFQGMSGVTKVTIADANNPLAFNYTRWYGNGAFDSFEAYTAYLGRNIELNYNAKPPFYSGGSRSMTALTIGDQVTTLPDYAFYCNRKLATATIGTGLTAISEYAFNECSGLTGISIPGNVKRIEKNAFAGDTTMTTVTLNEGLDYIGYRAFENCKKVGELYLPASLDSIHSEAFQGMSGVKKVTIADSDQPLAFNHTRWYNNGAFDSFEAYTAHLGRNIELTDRALSPFYSGGNINRSLTALTIGDQVTTLPNYAFYRNKNMATATIGTGLTAISEYAFNECSGLTGISIPGNVKRIEKNAFASDTTMTTVSLNEGLDYIGYRAFENCKKVGELYLPASLDSIHSEAFQGMSGVKKVTIADSDQPLAFNHTRWYNNGAFDSFEAYTAHLGRNIELTDRALSPFYSGGSRSMTALTIGDHVTTLPNYAFYRNKNMATATIGTGLTAISEYAFNECSGLTGISIPGNVKRIEKNAFSGDTTMTAVTLNEGLVYIGYRAFENCKKVGELYLPATLDSIHSEAFYNMSGVKKVTIADSDQPLTFNHTRWYNNGAFKEMPLTTSLYIGRDFAVTDRAPSPLYNNQTVKNITLGEEVTTVIDKQFYNNDGLRNLTVNAVEPPACSTNAFADVNIDNITLTVPSASRNKYRHAPVWELFFDEEVLGDVNGDGFVTAADVTAIYNHLLNDVEISSAADVNGDGVITAADITALYNILLQQ